MKNQMRSVNICEKETEQWIFQKSQSLTYAQNG